SAGAIAALAAVPGGSSSCGCGASAVRPSSVGTSELARYVTVPPESPVLGKEPTLLVAPASVVELTGPPMSASVGTVPGVTALNEAASPSEAAAPSEVVGLSGAVGLSGVPWLSGVPGLSASGVAAVGGVTVPAASVFARTGPAYVDGPSVAGVAGAMEVPDGPRPGSWRPGS